MFAQSKPLPGTPLNWAHPLTRGLVGYWPMWEGVGSTTHDVVSLIPGTLTHIKSATSGFAGGRAGGSALLFDGVDDAVALPSLGTFGKTRRFTLAAWVNVNSLATSQSFVGQISAASFDAGLFFNTTNGKVGAYAEIGSGGADAVYSTSSLAVNTWTHVLGTFDGAASLMSVAINGVVHATVAYSAVLSAADNAGVWFIGKLNQNASNFNWVKGTIDGVQLWARVLTPQEIRQLYAQPYCMFAPPRVQKWMRTGRLLLNPDLSGGFLDNLAGGLR